MVTVVEALHFVDLIPANCPLPHIALAGDGEVNLSWKRNEFLLDVGFYGEGKIYYLIEDSHGLKESKSANFDGRLLPRAVLDAIPTV